MHSRSFGNQGFSYEDVGKDLHLAQRKEREYLYAGDQENLAIARKMKQACLINLRMAQTIVAAQKQMQDISKFKFNETKKK